MKAIILAAGKGRRLNPDTKEIPKPLIKVGGKHIIQYKIDALKKAGIKEEDIIIVTGYLHDAMKEQLSDKLTFIYNKDWETTNNMYSLWLARDYTKKGFLLLNADIIHHGEIIKRAINYEKSSFIAGDSKREVNDVKLKMMIDENGGVLKNTKDVPKEKAKANGAQIIRFSKEDAKAWMDYVRDTIIRKKNLMAGANIMNEEILKKMNMYYLEIGDLPWIEINTHEELKKAEELVKKMRESGDVQWMVN